MRSFRRAVPALLLSILASFLLALPATAPGAPTGRITGGTKTPDSLYQSHLRSIVALVNVAEQNQYDAQFCAGTLIDELHVLTAGHCLVDDGNLRSRLAPTSFAVLPGRSQLNERSMDRAALVPVQAMFINPNFNVRTMRWDVAVLRLARPITNAPVQPLLSADEAAALGMGSTTVNGLVAGWGDQDPESDDCCFPSALHSAQVPLHPDATCQENLADADYVSFTPEFQLCAGRLGSGSRLGADSCQGDSGGPLYVDAAGGPRLAGVTSFGVGCGQDFYGVYARATTIVPWLQSFPGMFDGDTRDPSHGPGDLAAPTVSSAPAGFSRVRLTITPASAGATPTGYTMWLRLGAPATAKDIFLGKTTSLTPLVEVPPTNVAAPYTLLVRPTGDSGEGPTGRAKALPVLDKRPPSRVTGLRVSRKLATWSAARDAQSGIEGYQVQLQVRGRWAKPKFVSARRLNVGSASRVRVRAVDWAGNPGAWSATVSI